MNIPHNIIDKFGSEYKVGTIIFCEHELGDYIYLLNKGKIVLTKVIDNKEKLVDILEEGAFFGDMALLEDAPRSATAIAQTNVEILKFDKFNFESLIEANPAIAINLLRLFSKRIFEAKRRFEILSHKDLESRVIDTLLMLSEKSNKTNFESRIELLTTAEMIANWCASKKEDVEKILHKYEITKKITIEKEKIIINKSMSELTRFILSKSRGYKKL